MPRTPRGMFLLSAFWEADGHLTRLLPKLSFCLSTEDAPEGERAKSDVGKGKASAWTLEMVCRVSAKRKGGGKERKLDNVRCSRLHQTWTMPGTCCQPFERPICLQLRSVSHSFFFLSLFLSLALSLLCFVCNYVYCTCIKFQINVLVFPAANLG